MFPLSLPLFSPSFSLTSLSSPPNPRQPLLPPLSLEDDVNKVHGVISMFPRTQVPRRIMIQIFPSWGPPSTPPHPILKVFGPDL